MWFCVECFSSMTGSWVWTQALQENKNIKKKKVLSHIQASLLICFFFPPTSWNFELLSGLGKLPLAYHFFFKIYFLIWILYVIEPWFSKYGLFTLKNVFSQTTVSTLDFINPFQTAKVMGGSCLSVNFFYSILTLKQWMSKSNLNERMHGL
jgi:hypothetical protein